MLHQYPHCSPGSTEPPPDIFSVALMHVRQTAPHVASKDWCCQPSDFQRSTTIYSIWTLCRHRSRAEVILRECSDLGCVARSVSGGLCCCHLFHIVCKMRNSFARLAFAQITQCWTSAHWGDIGCQIGGLNLSWNRGFRQPDLGLQLDSVFQLFFGGGRGPVSCEILVSTKCRVFLLCVLVFLSVDFYMFSF